MSTTQPGWRLNLRAASALAALIAFGTLGLCLLWGYQERRVLRSALAQVRKFRDAGEFDLAIRHLNQCLAFRPGDVSALDLKAQLLAETARTPSQMLEAAKLHERLLRLEPNGPRRQLVRRRLVELYVKYSDAHRSSAVYRSAPELAANDLRYHAAETIARQLIRHGARDAAAYRLLALALDGLAVPGDARALSEAIRGYHAVLRIDPGDIVAAERLARLYQDRLRNPTQAQRVLDDLLKTRPGDVAVRLVRHRYYVRLGLDARSAAELEAATRLAPDNLSVLLAAAEDALRRTDMAGARRNLDKVPAQSRGDLRVLLIQGLVDFGHEHPEEAISSWRQGIVTASGTDAELTWWLAYALLQMGRLAEARPLVAQYRRLEGDDSPLYHFLAALQDERTGRPIRAIADLEWARDRLSAPWQGMLQLALGRCYEALWDESKALKAYRRACQLDAEAVVPRLAVARLLLNREPEEAIAEIERGLAAVPNDPGLLIALAGAVLRQQVLLRPDRRDWGGFDQVLKRAAEAAPGSPALVVLRADRLALVSGPEEAVRFLEQAAGQAPRNAAVAMAWADSLIRLDRPSQALQVLEQASAPEAAGDLAVLRIARARLLTALGRGREARAVFVRDVDRLPAADRPQVWVTLGQLLANQGDVAGARKAYTEWAKLLRDDPRPWLALLELALDGNDETAVREAVEALWECGGPNDIAWRLGRAQELLQKRVPQDTPVKERDAPLEEAGNLIDAVLVDAPELPAAQLLRGQILERRGHLDEAIAAYHRAWDRGIEAALPRLTQLLTRRRRFDELLRLRQTGETSQPARLPNQALGQAEDKTQAEADQIAEQTVQEAGQTAKALTWRARMLNHLGRFEDAETTLRALAERQPHELDPWLALLRFQAQHQRSQAAAVTVESIKAQVKTDRPELLSAQCCWTVGDQPGADQAFAEAVERYPDDPETRLTAAKFYEETERPAQAEACLKHVLARDPGHRPAARQLAIMLSAQIDDATAWDRAWAALGPESSPGDEPEDRLARAVVLARSPDPARRGQAIGLLEALVADLPVEHATAVAARDHLARLLLEFGRPDRASEVAAVSAASDSDPAAIALYAKTLLQSKQPDAAEWQLDRLAAVNPGDTREAALRARTIWDRSRSAEAAAAIERAYLVREDLPGAEALGREAFLLLAERGPDVAKVAERLGRRLAQRNPAASWMPALILARRGHHKEALAFCRAAALAGRPEDLHETGQVAMEVAVAAAGDAGALNEAEAVLETALTRAPGADELLVMMALLRHLQGRYDLEVRLYRDLLTRRPENALVLNNLAWALSEGLHQPSEALPYINELAKRSGRTAQTLDTRGVILTRLGRVEEAIKDLEEVVRAEPTGLHHFHLARAYHKSGRVKEARIAIQRARQADLARADVDLTERAELEALMGL